jgi:hypothetical protein
MPQRLTVIATGTQREALPEPEPNTPLPTIIRWFLEHYHYSRHIPPETFWWSIRKGTDAKGRETWYLFDRTRVKTGDLTHLEAMVTLISDTRIGVWTVSNEGYHAAEEYLAKTISKKLIRLPKPTSI